MINIEIEHQLCFEINYDITVKLIVNASIDGKHLTSTSACCIRNTDHIEEEVNTMLSHALRDIIGELQDRIIQQTIKDVNITNKIQCAIKDNTKYIDHLKQTDPTFKELDELLKEANSPNGGIGRHKGFKIP